ncbi:translation initiation factor IF-3 [Dethiosulfatarculus sandiegensis]|uniref:Translation initiation factor IF-3 n=1 Tax=Dethiosulfatarculus sandiegensis TaxID=1429043 RepID=A0A0D2G997_9BACT|nr:translation initiation factor IF-3 [Dethiosulfatarculus sandiegensis]
MNNMIKSPMVRLINAEGEQAGIVSIEDANRLAHDAGLDLVEVAPNADPPVCRVMDYGKYKYQQAKKAQEGKKKQAQTQVKEMKFRPKIADHDFNFKMRKVLTFLEEHNRVKVSVQFRGREIAYKDSGRQLLERVAQEAEDLAVVVAMPKMEGRFMTMVLAPR